MYVDTASLDDLEVLKAAVQNNQVVAIGEIGLDYLLDIDHPIVS